MIFQEGVPECHKERQASGGIRDASLTRKRIRRNRQILFSFLQGLFLHDGQQLAEAVHIPVPCSVPGGVAQAGDLHAAGVSGLGGNVFENLELRPISDDELRQFDHIFQGVDWGWFPDQYAFIRLHYDKTRETIYLLDENYGNRMSNEETAKWILDRGYPDRNNHLIDAVRYALERVYGKYRSQA